MHRGMPDAHRTPSLARRNLMDKPVLLNHEALLWEHARQAGMSRREFLRLLALAGSAALLASCGSPSGTTTTPMAPSTTSGSAVGGTTMFAKAEDSLIKVFATELGTRWDQSQEFLTPVEQFYVRNRYPSPIVDHKAWRLKVSGDAV